MNRRVEGSVVVVDWPGGSVAGEPGYRRPAVVVENRELFPDAYPTTLVVPLTHDEGLAHPGFAVQIDPGPDNGVATTCWALAHHHRLMTVADERGATRTRFGAGADEGSENRV